MAPEGWLLQRRGGRGTAPPASSCPTDASTEGSGSRSHSMHKQHHPAHHSNNMMPRAAGALPVAPTRTSSGSSSTSSQASGDSSASFPAPAHSKGPPGRRLSHEDASAAHAAGDTSVGDLIRRVSQLPPAAPVQHAVSPGHLAALDGRALAALLKGLGKGGRGGRAAELFDHLRALPPSHRLARTLCDVYAYTTMIAQCTSRAALHRALELAGEMRARGIAGNAHSYSALMNACLKAGEAELALDVYHGMLAEEVPPNLVTYHTLLEVYAKTGRASDALAALQQLQRQGLHPEARTFNSVMAACAAAGRHEEAARVFQQMTAAGVEPNGASFSAAVAATARSGQLDDALKLLATMGARGCERGAHTFAAVLAACEAAGRWEVALQLLREMQAVGVRLTNACLASAMGACLQGGEPARGEQLFEEASGGLLRPDAASFNALLRTYCAQLKLREAANLVDVMHGSGLAVAPAALDALCGAKTQRALQAVQAFEASLVINAQAMPPALLSQRAELVQLLLQGGAAIGLPVTAGHDAAQLLDRLLSSPTAMAALAGTSGFSDPASGAAGIISGPLLAAACLHTAARSSEDLQLCAAVFGVAPQQLLVAGAQVQQLLASSPGLGSAAVSSMRVLQLLLERLGVTSDGLDAATTTTLPVCGHALVLLDVAAASPAFVGCPPSQLAVAVLFAARLAAGLTPTWPAALATLTGIAEPAAASGGLARKIEAALELLLLHLGV